MATTTWKSNARAGYADSLWLYDNMTEAIAVWRGNAKYDGTTDVDATAGTAKAQDWRELQTRQKTASDSLYALEAAAPDNQTAATARNAITTMKATREALDARAESRYAYRKAEGDDADADTLSEVRNREVRTSRNLADARSAYAKALSGLAAIA